MLADACSMIIMMIGFAAHKRNINIYERANISAYVNTQGYNALNVEH